ncbi:expansin-B15-like protein [Tanacetum coccineum]
MKLNSKNTPFLFRQKGEKSVNGEGGACGWEDDVKDPPFSSMISAGNAKYFFKRQRMRTLFSGMLTPYNSEPITVTISDECPGLCNTVPFHFDLSGFAFGAMAHPGQDHNLRMLGQVDVQYQRRNRCKPGGFSIAIEYCQIGDGGFGYEEIAEGGRGAPEWKDRRRRGPRGEGGRGRGEGGEEGVSENFVAME